jgi:small-conductance mechanosensitive channel
MEERRVLFRVGVVYRTPPETLEQIPGMIGEIIAGIPGTRFERSHFLEFGVHSLVIETVYHINGPDYLDYARIQQAVNLGIIREFRRNGVEFAYPTQTLHIQR